MRWQNQRRSDNVRNRRGGGGGAMGAGGIGLILMLGRMIFSRFGIGGIVVLVGGYFALKQMGIDPLQLVNGGGLTGAQSQAEGEAPTSEYDEMVRAVLGSTEDIWTDIFREEGLNGGVYPQPVLNLFNGRINTACGGASSAVGPFYCPGDQDVYIDTAFFQELQRRFNVPGDFPPAYVIAHEVGHHVQTVTGTSNFVRRNQQGAPQAEQNLWQVRMELQADCYAGLWARRWREGIEPGDIDEALRAAEAIGDDALQMQAGQRNIDPSTFTHGVLCAASPVVPGRV